MIVAFVGTPGSGKTYEAVKKILANLKTGRRVYTNIDGINEGQQREFIKNYLDIDDYELTKRLIYLDKAQVERFWEIVKDGSLIVLDEIHKTFSNRDWNSVKNKQFADWCSTHRHAGFDVVFVTQDMQKVESHTRSLIEWTYVFRKVNFLGSAVSGKYICYSHAGDDITGKPLSTNTRTYDKSVFNCYNSYVAKDAKEVTFMTHVNILKHPVFLIIPCILAFFLYMLMSKSSFATGDLFGTNKVAHKHDAKSSVSAVTPAPVVPPPAPFSNIQRPLSSAKLNHVPAQSFQQVADNTVTVTGYLDINPKLRRLLLSDGRIVTDSKKGYLIGDSYNERGKL